jgi:DNA recombination protein RmuC
MDALWLLGAGLLLGGAVAVALAARRAARAAEAAAAEARSRAATLESEVRRLAEERSRLAALLEAERRAAQDRRAEAERSREQVRAEVEKLAGRLLEQQGKVMLDRSREGLEALLRPVADRLQEFTQKVERTHATDVRERAALGEHLRALQEAQARLHRDAEALARALTRESKQQGDWGEIVLERVLEAAGLSRGREYELQVSHLDEEGRHKRPDALVFLPEDRAVVVDAKCSLTAFVEAARAADDESRERALDAHVASLRAHVKGLAGKRYTEVLRQRSLEFVMMFVPSEAAFFAGLSRDPGLWEEAFRQGVVLTSPTTLVAALRLVSQLWRTESQNQHARRIAEEAGRLLDKLSDFVGDLDQVGARLDQAQESLAAARGKLQTGRGNALRKAAEIARLGARVREDKLAPLLRAAGEDPEDALTSPEAAGPAAASRP